MQEHIKLSSGQPNVPPDWCGELDSDYVADWTRWAERRAYHRWSGTLPSFGPAIVGDDFPVEIDQ